MSAAMILRALDANGEWTFGKGKNNYLTLNAAIGQNIGSRLKSILGDCYFDTKAGLDSFNFMGSKDITGFQLAVNATIINSTGVTKVNRLSLSVDPRTRNIALSYDVDTVYTGFIGPNGTLTFSGTFLLTQDGVIITTEDGSPIST